MAAKIPDPRNCNQLDWQLAVTAALNELMGTGGSSSGKAAVTADSLTKILAEKLKAKAGTPMEGNGPPSDSPDYIGQTYIDRVNKQAWVAVKKAGADEECVACEWMPLDYKPGTVPVEPPGDNTPPEQDPNIQPDTGGGGSGGGGACNIEEIDVVTDIYYESGVGIKYRRKKVTANICKVEAAAATVPDAGDEMLIEVEECP